MPYSRQTVQSSLPALTSLGWSRPSPSIIWTAQRPAHHHLRFRREPCYWLLHLAGARFPRLLSFPPRFPFLRRRAGFRLFGSGPFAVSCGWNCYRQRKFLSIDRSIRECWSLPCHCVLCPFVSSFHRYQMRLFLWAAPDCLKNWMTCHLWTARRARGSRSSCWGSSSLQSTPSAPQSLVALGYL